MKKICFILSGQIRKNSLRDELSTDNTITDSFNEYIFNKKLKEKYDYDIFISTDTIDIKKTLNFFSKEKVKNIHCSNNDFYLNPITKNIPSVNYYDGLYHKNHIDGYQHHERSVYQYHRLYDCYNLAENYNSINNYDYIVRMRLDMAFNNDINNYLEILDNDPNIHIFCHGDVFAIGRKNIMKEYCTTINNKFGKYNKHYYKKNYNFKNSIIGYEHFYSNDPVEWSYSPEFQIYECLFEFCEENNLDIDSSLKYCNCGYLYR
jgi:hypothetical protein